MISILKNFIVLSIGTLLCGCVTTVDFSDGRAKSPAELPVVQVFYDKQGDIYPIDWQASDKKLTKNSDHSLICQFKQSLCGLTNFAIYSDSQKEAQYKAWRRIQEVENNRIVDEIVSELQSTNNKTVVMLVHGFRVPDAHEDYGKVKRALLNNRSNDESPVFLEVHWDGRQSRTLPISALKAWPPAQWTAPAVGFRLRPLINELNARVEGKGVDLFVLTHSTGAVVAGALFGNPKGALPCLVDEESANKCGANYTEFLTSIKSGDGAVSVPKWSDMNLVMLAAATSSATFAVPAQTDLGYDGVQNANLVFSHSKNDSALNKYIKLPSLLGYSGLGARIEDLKVVEDELSNVEPKRANVTVLEMSEELGGKHDMTEYIKTTEFSKVLDLLWD